MNIVIRKELLPGDDERIREVLESSGYFQPREIDVALELVQEALKKGDESGYYFMTAREKSRLAGYICYGPIPMTFNRWDIYWIAVDDRLRGRGIGGMLLEQTEDHIRTLGGRKTYIETSSSMLYAPTRRFHEKQGYILEAVQKDYYDDGDDRCLYVKVL
ncbi:GNAT family N-acetyltransferase [Marispirochaeta aestuarii]|uniref:GNAT family N-acetyltransferase n=1 Tax=Marispirochaeta aestuarii TaxID=1963862 RepID=UPI0029C6E541|nr:GNAT family N-acetyltransferase [Marispirochaeta aestuarii]